MSTDIPEDGSQDVAYLGICRVGHGGWKCDRERSTAPANSSPSTEPEGGSGLCQGHARRGGRRPELCWRGEMPRVSFRAAERIRGQPSPPCRRSAFARRQAGLRKLPRPGEQACRRSGHVSGQGSQQTPASSEASATCTTCHNRGEHALWDGSQHDSRTGCITCHSVHAPKSDTSS